MGNSQGKQASSSDAGSFAPPTVHSLFNHLGLVHLKRNPLIDTAIQSTWTTSVCCVSWERVRLGKYGLLNARILVWRSLWNTSGKMKVCFFLSANERLGVFPIPDLFAMLICILTSSLSCPIRERSKYHTRETNAGAFESSLPLQLEIFIPGYWVHVGRPILSTMPPLPRENIF